MKKTETFETLMKTFEYRHDLKTVFDDFTTLAICACGRNPVTGLSHEEELYLDTIAKYTSEEENPLRFARLFESMVNEMNDGIENSLNPDVLGEYYERNLYRKGAAQYFTPWHLCQLTAALVIGTEKKEGARIIDPACGSGRMLLAASRFAGSNNEYFGIDIDHTCVKMTALNLFFNGVFKAEVLWADALTKGDFRAAYRTSFLPFGIFKITDPEKSKVWKMYQNSEAMQRAASSFVPFEDQTVWDLGSQLKLF